MSTYIKKIFFKKLNRNKMESRTNCFISPRNYGSVNYYLFLPIVLIMLVYPAFSQQANLPCYSIAKQDGKSDQLHEYNPTNSVWKNLGNTDTYGIESIAVDNTNSIIYAVDNGIFGKINLITAKFDAIKVFGSATGAYGPVVMNDVCAIAFDEVNGVIYGVHRNGLNNALLFKFDPSNGNILPNQFKDELGNQVDYAKIESIPFGSPMVTLVTEIADIALDKGATILCAIYKEDNARILVDLNLENGSIERQTTVVYKEIEGIGFDGSNKLKATTSPNPNLNYFSSLYTVNITSFDTQLIEEISDNIDLNFVCIDCAKKIQNIQPCATEINITDFSPSTTSYRASVNINSNANVNQTTEYKAVDYINLDTYFEVDANVNFSAIIQENCEN